MTGAGAQLETLRGLLKTIYKDHSPEDFNYMWSQLLQILEENKDIDFNHNQKQASVWDSSTAVLITYADGVYSNSKSTLSPLKRLIDNHLGKLASIIHILPFLCSTSDGGFAVSSYEKVEPRFGDWDDINNLSENNLIMADLVLNHVSASHPWVHQFKMSSNPGIKYILSPSIKDDWGNVIRARNTSLFTSIITNQGRKDVWTTFGPDQVDVNWNEPLLILEFLTLIIKYLRNGIRWIRLDAIGFIWKEPSTTCLNMKQAHDLVKVLRILLKELCESGVLITETNVPEKENVSYLISGDEAQLAYNFPLPPLLLEALITNKADLVNKWLDSWPTLPDKTGFLNFTASHDGIGLRALEGLMEPYRLHNLLIACEKRGGLISHRRMSNGEDKPYELNISWWSAMADTGINRNLFQSKRFLLSQLFVMALKGVPAFYLQAIMASENDIFAFDKSGERRDLNRERFDFKSLEHALKDINSNASKNLLALNQAMTVRSRLKAFHPDEPMILYSKKRSDVVLFSRGIEDYRVWVLHNMTNKKLSFSFADVLLTKFPSAWCDCLNNKVYFDNRIELNPYAVHWLTQKK
ncbi:alpha-amylase family glycosyl hydrolase [Prochlorococcus marinus]|uniref:alpha-amylase family glycosyl hydrolase n=1 Tax=Prochlorococcus marinus TaxID=1219 RepID=UPI0022B5267F|nr:alpha-amylase family glycosyl hydrolase [Prochlorococcus marinus]